MMVYDRRIHLKLIKWMARSGLTDAEMAVELGITVRCFHLWKKRFPDVLDVLRKNKYYVDMLVEDSLLKRALGFEFTEQTITRRPVDEESTEQTPDGPITRNATKTLVVEKKTTRKRMAPDTTACIFWLKNRRPDLWRDVLRHEHTGKNEQGVQEEKRNVQQILTSPESVKLAADLIKRIKGGGPVAGPATNKA